ncbi:MULTISPECIES: Pr6Pr family membrane protein [unclassified Rathayibacter]|uniref:Pr6Pr family membrane protein n=1 Tax=unclassified Rathayibacter TaxID=2609250 RepID=UPI00188A97B7|nr:MULTISPECIES: Pr6Pr family membrane protein [unclassified Rathayibacter]MBF4461107.1 Pr6Pr family membrane protein [Rathayibacter sp. VKM Ac-2879]MBF4502518.1 Pr6Pr family membrane protein [Rathayibacter sp. VKM Ac-2878]
MRATFIVVRALVALAVLAATTVSFLDSHSFWVEARFRDRTTLAVNFFSYITVEACLLSVVVLSIGAVVLARGTLPEPRWLAWLRAATVSYMVVIGVVYNLLLRGTAVTGGGAGQEWTNEVMHVVAPLALVLDWLLAPGRRRLSWSVVPWILVFPVAWFVYTEIRAPLVYDQLKHEQVWYPYPFLDPRHATLHVISGGALAVVVYVLVMTAVFASVAWATVLVSRRGAGRLDPPSNPAPVSTEEYLVRAKKHGRRSVRFPPA